MKTKNVFLIIIIIAALVLAFAGCGSRNVDSSGEAQETNAKVDETPVEPEPEVVEQEVSAQIAEAADTGTTTDEFVGSWVGVDDPAIFANITKDGDKYKFEDSDGSYSAEFADGILKVEVAENDFAEVYVDKDSGNLVLTYQDSIIEYKRK